MISTTVYLYPDQLAELRALSDAEDVPVAEFLRDAIDEYVYPSGTPPDVATARVEAACRASAGKGRRNADRAARRRELAKHLAAEGHDRISIARKLSVSLATVGRYL